MSIVVSITGGIGTGKSELSSYISSRGFPVISSDTNAKQIMTSDSNVINMIKSAFGDESYLSDGSLNSAYISSIVFGTSSGTGENLEKLNSIVHPRTIELMIDQVEELEKAGHELVFVESALTFEAGLEEGFDYIIVVDSNEDNIIARVSQRSGMTAAEIKERINKQMPQSEKVRMADFVISNNGTIDELRSSIDFIINVLLSLGDESD